MRHDHDGGDRDWADARRNFEAVWAPTRWRFMRPAAGEPSVAELLGVDREYRARVGADRPEHEAPAPLRLRRDHREYVGASPSVSPTTAL